MNPRASLTIIGILVIILGIFPLASKAIPIPSIQNFPIEAGSVVYQSAIILIGILALFLSGKKKGSAMPQIIMQKA
jgi:hypothetical protein